MLWVCVGGLSLWNEWFFQVCCVERLILPFCIAVPFPCEPLLSVSRNPLQTKVHKSCHMKTKKPRGCSDPLPS